MAASVCECYLKEGDRKTRLDSVDMIVRSSGLLLCLCLFVHLSWFYNVSFKEEPDHNLRCFIHTLSYVILKANGKRRALGLYTGPK